MKKKPTYTHTNLKSNELKTKGNANGPVTSYMADPIELARVRAIPVPDYQKEKLLNRSMMGGNDIA